MEINLSNAKCIKLSWSAPVQLKKEKNKQDVKEDFVIEAYTGKTVERWWGNLAIDISGIKARKHIPILLNHNSSQIVGYSTRTYTDESFFVSGVFSEITDEAQKVKGLADEGFPWQASIGVQPLKIMSLEKGAKEKVNGKTVNGPAEIWLESEVFETSFVPLGADDNTSVSRFSKFEEIEQDKKQQEKEETLMDITLERLGKDAPDLLAQIQAEAESRGFKKGIEEENKRIQDVLSIAIPGHEKLVEELAFDKKTTKAEAAVQVLAAEKRILHSKQEELDKDRLDPVEPSKDTDDQPSGKKKTPATSEEFEADEKLKKEFGDFETFQAYQTSIEQGLVKTTK